jgi:hypothetical protein
MANPTFSEFAHRLTPAGTGSPVGYIPAQIRHAYGLDQIQFDNLARGDGTGQTIAIVDAYDDPTIAADLQAFDARFNLPAPPSFRVVAQDGSTNLPGTDPTGRGQNNWELETALDVEWAHAIAPGASILLVEAKNNSDTNLYAAVDFAARQPGVAVVSMSFGRGEGSGDTGLNGHFVTPSGHPGVTFVAASGDSGTVSYPAASPNVLAVGGTNVYLDANNNITSETAWSGSGGGYSQYEGLPSYQVGVVPPGTTRRANPDVAYDAGIGFSIYDSYNNGTATPWSNVGGTSAGAPQWAALVAITDQGRAQYGQGSLDGPTQLLPAIYALPASDFNDVTTGSNLGGSTAGPGYDRVTGRGTPRANPVVLDLVYSTITRQQQEDVFFVGNNGALYTAWAVNGGAWAGPAQIGPAGLAPAGARVTALMRNAGQEDVFFTGSDGALYTAWEVNGGAWAGPVRMTSTGLASAGSKVTAVKRNANQEDLFVMGTNGALYTAWEVNNGAWAGPAQIGPTGLAAAGAEVTALMRNASQEDVFFVGNNGALYTAWEVNNGAWAGPAQIGPAGLAPAGAGVTAVARNALQEDVFFVGNNGALYTAWEVGNGAWAGPTAISAPGLARAGARVTALMRGGGQEDVSFVGNNGALYTAWEVNGGAWNGPIAIGPSLAPSWADVGATMRRPKP